jgi:hypothetical protein
MSDASGDLLRQHTLGASSKSPVSEAGSTTEFLWTRPRPAGMMAGQIEQSEKQNTMKRPLWIRLFAALAVAAIITGTVWLARAAAPNTIDTQITSTITITTNPAVGNTLAVNALTLFINTNGANAQATNILQALQQNGLAAAGAISWGWSNANTLYIVYPINGAGVIATNASGWLTTTNYTNQNISFYAPGNHIVTGAVSITNAGYGLRIATGLNATYGVVTNVGSNTVFWVANTNIQAGGWVFLGGNWTTPVGTNATSYMWISNIVTGAGGGFYCVTTNSLANNIFGYLIVNPAP